MTLRAAIDSGLGLSRSLAIYYGRPARQRALERFYAGLLGRGDLAFDIGAHVGNRSRAMRAAGARVVAVEPQAPFAGFLRRTLPRDVALVTAAVGPKETRGALSVSRRHPTVSSLRSDFADAVGDRPGFEHVRWDAAQQVAVTTLDALIAEHGTPRLIKIDVEGFEAEVLAGLSRTVPLIAVEYLPALPDAARAALDRIAALGPYAFNLVTGEDGAFAWDDWRDDAAVRRRLDGLAPDDGPGDIYARLPG